jgi:hypothetical protein
LKPPAGEAGQVGVHVLAEHMGVAEAFGQQGGVVAGAGGDLRDPLTLAYVQGPEA